MKLGFRYIIALQPRDPKGMLCEGLWVFGLGFEAQGMESVMRSIKGSWSVRFAISTQQAILSGA